MNTFQEKLEQYVVPISLKIQKNPYVSAVSDGFSMVLPIIIIGAIFTLVGTMQFEWYQHFIEVTRIKDIVSFIPGVTTDLIALYTVYAISFRLSEKKEMEQDARIIGLLALVMFFVLIPLGTNYELESGENVFVKGVLSLKYLGAMGLFMSIIVGLLTPSIYQFVIKRGWVIKMPAGVPPTISKSFSALVPGFVLAIIFCLIRFAVSFTPYGDANNLIYTIIGAPLLKLGSNPVAFITLLLVQQLLWFFGIHGYLIIRPVLQTVFIPLSLANLAAYEAGTALPNMITYQHIGTYAAIGGSGALLGFAILMAFMAKSQRYKTLGKLGLPSAIFGINEPIIFGAPIVLNTTLFIPWILSPILMFIIPYTLQVMGFIDTLRGISLPLGTPVFLYGWLEGGMPILLVQAVLVIVQVLLWLPFFKIIDNNALKEEEGLKANEKAKI